jgi:hypothetical protein
VLNQNGRAAYSFIDWLKWIDWFTHITDFWIGCWTVLRIGIHPLKGMRLIHSCNWFLDRILNCAYVSIHWKECNWFIHITDFWIGCWIVLRIMYPSIDVNAHGACCRCSPPVTWWTRWARSTHSYQTPTPTGRRGSTLYVALRDYFHFIHFLPRTSAHSFREFFSVDCARTHVRSLYICTFLPLQTALVISFERN